VVEQDAVARVHAVRLPVIHRDPVGVELGRPVGAAGVERRFLVLGDLLHLAEQLARGGLVEPRLALHAEDAQGLQDPQGTQGIGLRRVLGRLERDLHVALGTEVVDLVRLHLLDDADDVRGVREVAVVEDEPQPLLVGVLVEMVNAVRVKARRPSLDAVDQVSPA